LRSLEPPPDAGQTEHSSAQHNPGPACWSPPSILAHAHLPPHTPPSRCRPPPATVLHCLFDAYSSPVRFAHPHLSSLLPQHQQQQQQSRSLCSTNRAAASSPGRRLLPPPFYFSPPAFRPSLRASSPTAASTGSCSACCSRQAPFRLPLCRSSFPLPRTWASAKRRFCVSHRQRVSFLPCLPSLLPSYLQTSARSARRQRRGRQRATFSILANTPSRRRLPTPHTRLSSPTAAVVPFLVDRSPPLPLASRGAALESLALVLLLEPALAWPHPRHVD